MLYGPKMRMCARTSNTRELMAPLFMGDDEELQALIRDHLILPCLFGHFTPPTYKNMQAAF